jgi:hypothetical protein
VVNSSEIQVLLRTDVERLAAPGTRRVGTHGHQLARDYLIERLTALGLAPYRGDRFALPYRAGRQDFENLIGVVPGQQPGLAPVLVAAHYDTVDTPGADDNAAAVAIALETARRLLEARPQRDVVIALFDAEEPPYFHSEAMGSIRFFEDQRQPAGFHAAVVMDLVGHDVPFPHPALAPRIAPLLFVTGTESHPALASILLGCRQGPQLPVVATLNRRVGDMSDHHAFRLGGVPYLFLSCGRWPHYHARTDTPEKLNYAKMERICGHLTCLAERLAGTELPPAALDSEGRAVDTTALEIQLLEEALGAAGVSGLLSAVGLRQLRTAADLDRLAAVLQGYFEL